MPLERSFTMKTATNQERLNELFDADPRNDSSIASELGVSKQTISAWRSGFRSPKKPMLIKIAELYHVSIEWLMGFDVDRSSSGSSIVIPDTDMFRKIMENMSAVDYDLVMDAFTRTMNNMKKKGLL